jgi:hypothetical protein
VIEIETTERGVTWSEYDAMVTRLEVIVEP